MNVLVADDAAANRRLLARALESLGHAVSSAADGEELIRMALASSPDLILSDIDMPRLDGLSACLHVRSLRPDVRVLLMTGDPAAAGRAAREGFVSVLIKPFDLERLRELL